MKAIDIIIEHLEKKASVLWDKSCGEDVDELLVENLHGRYQGLTEAAELLKDLRKLFG